MRLFLVVALLGGSLVAMGASPSEAAGPALKLISGERAVFSGELPTSGIRTIKLQVKSGKKWRTVDTARTREGGEFELVTNRVRKTSLYRVYAPKALVNGWIERAYTSGSTKVAVLKQSTSLTLPSRTLVNETMTATLKSFPAREGRTLQLEMKKGQRWVVAADGKADANGRAIVDFTPTATGSFSFRTVAKAWKGASSKTSTTKTVRVTLGTPRIATATLPDASADKPYAVTLVGAGGATPYRWKLTGLPEGLSLNTSTGTISGTPTVYGGFTPSATLTDNLGRTTSRDVPLKVTADTLAITTASLPDAAFDEPYAVTLAGHGGANPRTWKVTGLPAGLTHNTSTGTISGMPTVYGDFTLNTTLTDKLGATTTRTLSLKVTADPLTITTASLPQAAFGEPYAMTLAGTGGAAPYTWAATGLPEGLSLDIAAGTISGTSTVYGTYTTTATLADKMGRTTTRTFLWSVSVDALSVQTDTLPDARYGEPYAATLVGTGGATPYAWAASGLPEGLSLDTTTGLISGRPTVYGTYSAGVALTDKIGKTVTTSLSLAVTADALTIRTDTLPDARYGEPYAATLAGTGGAIPYTWKVTGLPAELSLDTDTGDIIGTPKRLGDFSLQVTATDRMTATTSRTLSLAVRADATAVAAGGSHTCALAGAGVVLCWGFGGFGALGAGTHATQYNPGEVSGLTSEITQIATGSDQTCAVSNSGAASCWGRNNYGQLGDGTTTDRSAPVQVSGLTSGITQTAAGYYHTCALTDTGSVWCWGENVYGQLGDGTTTDRSTPVQVSGLTSRIIQIATGYLHTCALTDTGSVWCWGHNNSHELGDGTYTDRTIPVQVSELIPGIIQIAAGGSHTCALTKTGAAQCWGYNGYGQLGDGTATIRDVPVQVSGLTSGVTQIAAGGSHTCALTNTGAAQCWGYNYHGELGDGTHANQYTPVQVSGLTSGITQITAGYDHTCALTDASAVKCWGTNLFGRLGDGTTTDRYTPVQVTGFE
jgi:alpha-tubulin suppressor-like RCC1 family protein